MTLIFGESPADLPRLSRDQHVWLMSTAANEAQARRAWDHGAHEHSPLRGVTTFKTAGASAAECYRMLTTVGGHHDEHSAVVPWTAIHVRGISLDDISDDRISDSVGVAVRVLPEPDGFVVIRAAQRGAAADDRLQAGDLRLRVEDVVRSDPSSEDREDEEVRQLRRANSLRLLMFPLMVALSIIGWIIWYAATADSTNTR